MSKRLTAVGFEPTPVYTDQNTQYLAGKLSLESGALDRSATLFMFYGIYAMRDLNSASLHDLYGIYLIFQHFTSEF
ncbi:hypothetical protein T02_15117 [Trichinella nativa]|uniref:Uncharacterized protein n=1 Tax=Trichinella nativa TaxID=6335 RepID=A0A0V1LFR2_9BILA|nr:hypothetical protein T02_15117 [Trichinella nativa]